MAKSFLHRLFGIGSVPAALLPVLREEGLVLMGGGRQRLGYLSELSCTRQTLPLSG